MILDGSKAIVSDCDNDLCEYCPNRYFLLGQYYNDRYEVIDNSTLNVNCSNN